MSQLRNVKTALITGMAGSGGSYLAEHIVNHCPGVSVHGIARWHSASSPSNLAEIADKVTQDLQGLSVSTACLWWPIIAVCSMNPVWKS